jgi:hypothetical protein
MNRNRVGEWMASLAIRLIWATSIVLLYQVHEPHAHLAGLALSLAFEATLVTIILRTPGFLDPIGSVGFEFPNVLGACLVLMGMILIPAAFLVEGYEVVTLTQLAGYHEPGCREFISLLAGLGNIMIGEASIHWLRKFLRSSA